MIFFLYLLVCIFSYSPLHAMKQLASHDSDTYALQARQNLEKAFQGADAAQYTINIKRAGICAQIALGKNPNGATQELTCIKAFSDSRQAFEKDNYDETLSCCVDVINGPFNTPLLKKMRIEALGMVTCLADQKKHVIANFYLIKHLVNSTNKNNVQNGLTRFLALGIENLLRESSNGIDDIFKHSEILDDIKKLADQHASALAQYILGEIHLRQAELGKLMDGTEADRQEELRKALAYAQLSKKGNYAQAGDLIKLIREVGASLHERSITPELVPLVAAHSPVPLKVLATLAVYKNLFKNDSRNLYVCGKKLVYEESDQLSALGVTFLKEAAQLGHPFAAELAGDALYETDPKRALAYYYKALHIFTHSHSGSLWKFAGCFKRQSLERKLSVLSGQEEGDGGYLVAREYGHAAALEQALYGIYNKNHIEALAGIVHGLEAHYVQNKLTVDTLFLELLQTSGVLRFMELFCEHEAIQDVLIEIFALRGNIGRGFVLEEKTILAHYKKALHFILDPASASKCAFKDSVADELLLKKVELDALPLQRRLIYVDAMLGIITQLTHKELVDKKDAEYACQLFLVVEEAIQQTTDAHLKNLAYERYTQLLANIRQSALVSGSRDHLYAIGRCFAVVGMNNGWPETLEQADKLLTQAHQVKGTKPYELRRDLAGVKIARAYNAQDRNDIQAAYNFCKKAVHVCSEDRDIQWQCSQFLVKSGQLELRTEGVAMAEKLAQTGHREAQAFMVDGYCGKMPHLIALDREKAIPLLEQLIQDEQYAAHRIMLANIYGLQAHKATGTDRQRLIARALDLIRPYAHARTFDNSHLMYIDLLRASKRTQEALSELHRYQPAGQLSEKRVYELASAYLERATVRSNQIRQVFQAKAAALLQTIKDTSERAYLLLLAVLFERCQFEQLACELAVEKKTYMNCVKECFQARALLMQQKTCPFDQVIVHCERAFEAYENNFICAPAIDMQALTDLISSAGVSECVTLTHPMKVASLEHIEKVTELLSFVIMQGDCDDQERMRMLAYNCYFTAKIALLCLGKDTTYDEVIKLCSKAQEAACGAGDQACKVKLLKLICDQTHYWTDEPASGTIAVRAKTVSCLIGLCTKLCKDNDAAFLQTPFHDIVVYADRIIGEFDLSACTADERQTVSIHQQIVARHKSNLKDT